MWWRRFIWRFCSSERVAEWVDGSSGPWKKLAGKVGVDLGWVIVKRPIAFCFVAAWFSLCVLAHVSSLTRPVKTYVIDGQNHSLFGLLLAVVFIFALWQIAGLSQ